MRMLIDCDTCVARDLACGDCVVTVLLELKPHTPEPLDLDDAERAAIGSLAEAGLVPPLRLVSDSPGVERDIA
jgi:hypothetical protein